MRINQFVAQATGVSRRKADNLIADGKIIVNGKQAHIGQTITDSDNIIYNNQPLAFEKTTTIMLNKPVGYVCSRDGQGSKTIYDILPKEFHDLKPVGRLDKDSSGLLLLTNDGNVAEQLTHPKYEKEKVYEVTLNKALLPEDHIKITQTGVNIGDFKLSRMKLEPREKGSENSKLQFPNSKLWLVTMSEGRNRQIRRTFEKLGYNVTQLHRTKFGSYTLENLSSGNCITL